MDSNEKKSVSTMNIVLAIIGIELTLFTAAMVWLYHTTGSIPETLVTAVFTACTGELGIMGWIKSAKEKYRDREWQKEDEETKIAATATEKGDESK